MKVIALINLLMKFPSNMEVVTPGFDECGLEKVQTVEEVNVVFKEGKRDSDHWSGTHEHGDYGVDITKDGVKCVLVNF